MARPGAAASRESVRRTVERARTGRRDIQVACAPSLKLSRVALSAGVSVVTRAATACVGNGTMAAPLIPARKSFAVAIAHWKGKSDRVEVPRTQLELHSVFWGHPTPIAAAGFVFALAALRHWQGSYHWWDCGAFLLGVLVWVVQEWAIHKKLFHGDLDWFGKRIHIDHHKSPYYHISIDDCFIAFGVMLLSTLVCFSMLGLHIGADVDIGYIMAGLCYQFTHYSVHCRYVPTSKIARRVRAHHMQHHCRNENFWLSFTLPQMDTLMNTNPSPSSVPMTEMAKAAVRNKA